MEVLMWRGFVKVLCNAANVTINFVVCFGANLQNVPCSVRTKYVRGFYVGARASSMLKARMTVIKGGLENFLGVSFYNVANALRNSFAWWCKNILLENSLWSLTICCKFSGNAHLATNWFSRAIERSFGWKASSGCRWRASSAPLRLCQHIWQYCEFSSRCIAKNIANMAKIATFSEKISVDFA